MGILNESVKEIINESSLNRVIHWLNNHDVATITAFRGSLTNVTDKTLMDKNEGEAYSKPENKRRNKQMKATLLKYGYGVTNISGVYIENFKTPDAKSESEESFLVVNLNDDSNFFDNLFDLSEKFNQDSFLYKAKGEKGYLVGTNNAEFPGYGERECVGDFIPNVASQFMSRIGNTGFVIGDENTELDRDNAHTSFQDRKKDRIAEAFDRYDKYSTNSKRVISNLAKGILKS